MVNHKKHSGSRPKASSSAPPSSTVDQTSSPTPPPSDDTKAVRDAQRALTAIRQGNLTKAEEIVKKSLSKYKNSPILHRVKSKIDFNFATLFNHSNTKLYYLNNSAKSAQRATTLSSNSFSSSLFYVRILFELSKQNKGYDKVIQECNRALSIKNPIDPKKDRANLKNEIRKFKMRMMVVKMIDVDGNVKSQSERDRDRESKDLLKKKEVEFYELKNQTINKDVWNFDSCLNFGYYDYFGYDYDACWTRNRLEQLRKYWNERMSDERKKRLLEVRIDEVKRYFDKNDTAREVLKESIGYAKEKGNWKFWECCICGEKFVDCEVWVKHYEEKHVVVILDEKLKSFVPSTGVDCKWVDMIENGDWRPVDTLLLEKMIRIGLKVDKEWPLSGDVERAKILKRIHCMLKLFLRHKCLAVSLIGRMISDASGELKTLIPKLEFQIPELDETLHCLRFLGVAELNNALKFLEEVCDLCGLSDDDEVSDTNNSMFDIKERIRFEINERITFSSDFKCLVLDKRLLRKELIIDMYKNDVLGDSSVTSSVDDHKFDLLPIIDDNIIPWLSDFPIEKELASWTRLREDKYGRKKVFEVFATEFSNLKSLCERKCDIYNNVDAVRRVEATLDVEITKINQFPESEIQSFASLLRERRKRIIQLDRGDEFRSSQFQLDAITDVLEEALSLSYQFIFEDCVKDDDQMKRDCLDQANYFIQEAIRRLHLRLFDELAKIDPMIMRSDAVVQQSKLKLRRMCAYDYRSIMLPMLKLFIKARLENFVDKDRKKHVEFKATGGNEHLLHQEDGEQVDVPVASMTSVDKLKKRGMEFNSDIVMSMFLALDLEPY